jgi:ubiquinone/menaquinone biosynthesis C-methylase UbiE
MIRSSVESMTMRNLNAAKFRSLKKRQETRSVVQIEEHYELETALADRLRHSTREERKRLYSESYDELFRRIPHHSQLTQPIDHRNLAQKQVRVIRAFLRPEMHFAEIGAGDAWVAKLLARECAESVAFDITDKAFDPTGAPSNFRFVLIDGINLPLSDRSIDVFYSNQLMEHLHPDDALAQLAEIWRVLKPGGIYFCITPNRLAGPHDISRYFDDEPRGFHLKEYTNGELVRLLTHAGFSKIVGVFVGGGRYFGKVSPILLGAMERSMMVLPTTLRQVIASTRPFRLLLGVKMLAFK